MINFRGHMPFGAVTIHVRGAPEPGAGFHVRGAPELRAGVRCDSANMLTEILHRRALSQGQHPIEQRAVLEGGS